jgi:hypothetical protein
MNCLDERKRGPEETDVGRVDVLAGGGIETRPQLVLVARPSSDHDDGDVTAGSSLYCLGEPAVVLVAAVPTATLSVLDGQARRVAGERLEAFERGVGEDRAGKREDVISQIGPLRGKKDGWKEEEPQEASVKLSIEGDAKKGPKNNKGVLTSQPEVR